MIHIKFEITDTDKGIIYVSKSQLYNRFKNSLAIPTYYEESRDLLIYLDFFARFLSIYAIFKFRSLREAL
jgi:hypothetical protein